MVVLVMAVHKLLLIILNIGFILLALTITLLKKARVLHFRDLRLHRVVGLILL